MQLGIASDQIHFRPFGNLVAYFAIGQRRKIAFSFTLCSTLCFKEVSSEEGEAFSLQLIGLTHPSEVR